MIKQDIFENQARTAYLGIGSNLGDKSKNINLAKFKIKSENVRIIKCSSHYESLSWPNPKKPKFINIVLEIKTTLEPIELLNFCNKIEKQLGRLRHRKNDPRTCDIDILDYDHKVFHSKNKKQLILPHPEICKRNFVLLPLFEISKNWKHPKSKVNIAELINSIKIGDIRVVK